MNFLLDFPTLVVYLFAIQAYGEEKTEIHNGNSFESYIIPKGEENISDNTEGRSGKSNVYPDKKTKTYNFLMLSVTSFKSHMQMFWPIARELARRGHKVRRGFPTPVI